MASTNIPNKHSGPISAGICSLPKECMEAIFSWLPLRDLALSLSLVNGRFHESSRDYLAQLVGPFTLTIQLLPTFTTGCGYRQVASFTVTPSSIISQRSAEEFSIKRPSAFGDSFIRGSVDCLLLQHHLDGRDDRDIGQIIQSLQAGVVKTIKWSVPLHCFADPDPDQLLIQAAAFHGTCGHLFEGVTSFAYEAMGSVDTLDQPTFFQDVVSTDEPVPPGFDFVKTMCNLVSLSIPDGIFVDLARVYPEHGNELLFPQSLVSLTVAKYMSAGQMSSDQLLALVSQTLGHQLRGFKLDGGRRPSSGLLDLSPLGAMPKLADLSIKLGGRDMDSRLLAQAVEWAREQYAIDAGNGEAPPAKTFPGPLASIVNLELALSNFTNGDMAQFIRLALPKLRSAKIASLNGKPSEFSEFAKEFAGWAAARLLMNLESLDLNGESFAQSEVGGKHANGSFKHMAKLLTGNDACPRLTKLNLGHVNFTQPERREVIAMTLANARFLKELSMDVHWDASTFFIDAENWLVALKSGSIRSVDVSLLFMPIETDTKCTQFTRISDRVGGCRVAAYQAGGWENFSVTFEGTKSRGVGKFKLCLRQAADFGGEHTTNAFYFDDSD